MDAIPTDNRSVKRVAQTLAEMTAALFPAVDMEPRDVDELREAIVHRCVLWMATRKQAVAPGPGPISPTVIPKGLGDHLLAWAITEKASVSFGFNERHKSWSIMTMFGEEAPDSPMAGGSTLGLDESLAGAITQALGESGLNQCATCGWEGKCEGGCHS